MASLAAKAARNRDVRTRLDAALKSISKRLNIPIPDESRRMRDADLQPIVELERFASFAESVDAAIAHLASADEAPGGYEALTVPMLKQEISKRGLEVPKKAKKLDLVALLEAADAEAKAGEPEGDAGGANGADGDESEDGDESQP